MKLILTRHGETEGNVNKILADIDDPLTPNGWSQIEKLSEALKDEHIDAIYSSPILRAENTAIIIAKNHPNAKFTITDDLKEMELGSYLNKGYGTVDWHNRPTDVESKISLHERALSVLNRAFQEYPKGTVLFVGHNAINKTLIRFLRGLHIEDRNPILQANTAISTFEINKNNYKEIIFNDTKHLK